jgi:hypothetical protein
MAERGGFSTTYPQIEAPEVRVGLRTGEILMLRALMDKRVRGELAMRGITPGDFAADDGTGLFPREVIKRLLAVGGDETVIRVVGEALRGLDSHEMNGDKEEVRAALADLLQTYDPRKVQFSPRVLEMIESSRR